MDKDPDKSTEQSTAGIEVIVQVNKDNIRNLYRSLQETKLSSIYLKNSKHLQEMYFSQ